MTTLLASEDGSRVSSLRSALMPLGDEVYRRCLGAIEQDIAAPNRGGDGNRASRARAEQQFLELELSSAVASATDRRSGSVYCGRQLSSTRDRNPGNRAGRQQN